MLLSLDFLIDRNFEAFWKIHKLNLGGFMVLRLLIKEFWFPFVCATLWCVYNMADQHLASWSLSSTIKLFVAAFFFVSWFLGQYFRVSKQARNEKGIQLIDDKVSQVVQDLQNATKDLIGYQTGGESFCYLAYSPPNSSSGMEFIIHQGKYPLYEVNARIVDLDEFNPGNHITFSMINNNQRSFGNLIPGYCKTGNAWNLGEADEKKFNIFWTTRGGGFTQLLRFKKINGHWHYATKVERDKILYESVTSDYPRNSEGGIDW